MCYTDIFLGKKGLCVKLGFVCVTTIDPIFSRTYIYIYLLNDLDKYLKKQLLELMT